MSWEQLQAIQQENRMVNQQRVGQPPTSCPIDGERLEINKRNERNCPIGNFRWP